MNIRQYIPAGILVAVVVAFQLAVVLTGQDYLLTQLTMSAYYALVIIGLSVLMGYAGQISIGHAAFFAIGGYTAAVLTTGAFRLSPWLSLAVAVAITVVIAFLIGIPILKLKGHYLAMATLSFGVIVYRIVLGTGVFGEADGISDVPGFTLLPGLTVTGGAASRVENYYIAWFLVTLAIILLINLINSRVGRALRSIHGSEEAANAMGVNTAGYKLAIFVLSAVFAAVGGVFLTHYTGGIGPSEAGVMKSVRYVAIVAVGGMANIWGALVMGIVLNYLSLRGYFGTYDDIFFGAILIIIMLFYPDGILQRKTLDDLRSLARSLVARIRGRR
ncbi:MAG TPA: branched-chain amino acid ABC transporter permease [Spirochaetota bacterium]|nr:branched-chain amino acid ABC transporter permease [Spirochaetota bacterium]HNT11956.1 branched-chain amino acid ABC transporter permease [Spirochaetota bacterium]HNV48457.1 branched-chain amino acid ABC transporter permease [Spirochaetota bacterium]HOS41094.1 branched-chain amino acid ABC transporter permease [Spirochaetota bacterium]HPU88498.1 branched-chain amino acid ABC transporter permease [Spirochaetota bacterium]